MAKEVGVPQNVLEKQRYYQSVHKLTHLKGPYDRLFSVVIPLGYAAVVTAMIGRGLYNMAHGVGKIE